jgi:hypothetical protein
MASKCPHKLILIDGKHWKCMLGCNWGGVAHPGQTHWLITKRATCWRCGDHFIVDEQSLKNPKPICDECALIPVEAPLSDAEYMKQLEERRKQPLSEEMKEYLKKFRFKVPEEPKKEPEKDQIEVYEPEEE